MIYLNIILFNSINIFYSILPNGFYSTLFCIIIIQALKAYMNGEFYGK